jgi:hypothetical protein
MSAFIVSDTHIDALLTAGLILVRPHGPLRWFYPEITVLEVADATRPGVAFTEDSVQLVEGRSHELREDNATDVGAMLVAANRDSVNFRYGEEAIEPPYRFRRLSGTPDPLAVLKAIGCYEYQSCEHPGWRACQARQFCDALREVCIGCLPGYEEAPWEISDRNIFLRR